MPVEPDPTGLVPTLRGAAAALLLLLALPAAAQAPGELTPREVLDRFDDLYRGASSHAVLAMTVVTEHWTRELRLEAWSQGREKSLFRILSPRKEKGTATLKSGRQMWNYLPKVDRVIKVPSSMMGSSWMGSHFTNDDLVKESRMAEDYDFEFGEATGDGEIAVVCIPKEEAPVVWGKVVVRVRSTDGMPLAVEYFDEEMEPARTMSFGDYRETGGRLVPLRMRIVPADEPEERTEIRYESIEFDLPLAGDLFSLRSLRD